MGEARLDRVAIRGQLGAAVHRNRAWTTTGLLERVFSNAFNGLVYPQIWEDPIVDMAALDVGPDDHMVCIASGGCNVMSYLTRSPASVTAVDLSPAHVALNRLKLAAALHLDHNCFFALFGRGDVKGNAALFDRALAPHLDPRTADWWNRRAGISGRRIEAFEKGFYKHGMLGRFIASGHLLARLLGVDFKRFLECRSLGEQRAWYETNVAPALRRPIVRAIVNNRASLIGLGIPPQQYEALGGAADGDMLAVLTERLRTLMCDFPLSENYFAWQAFGRGYAPGKAGPLPPYLEEARYADVKAGAERVRIVNRSLTDFLRETPADSKDCYVLLDAQDWMTDRQLNDLWAQITRTARPRARVIFRTAGVATTLPGRVDEPILSRWIYQAECSADLTRRDRSAIYGGFHLYRLAI